MNEIKRVAVVTGGSRGIGQAACLALAQKGYSIVVNYSGNAKAAAETVAQCEALGAEAMAFKANVAVADEVA
ncbi:SDR family NAD(P)-dependent oxidoreductase, partial [Eubacterium aggregans]